MANLKFADTHNMVAFLSKPKESDGFEQIVDFLNSQPIRYALTINPTIYTSCIEQFWFIVKAKTINGEVQLHALVDEQEVVAKGVNLTVDEVTLAQALAALKSVKSKIKVDVIKEHNIPVSTASASTKVSVANAPTKISAATTTTGTIPTPRKGIVINELELEPVKPTKKKVQIMLDEEIALKLQANIDEEKRFARDEEENIDEANIAWDDIQAKVNADYQLAERLQAEEQDSKRAGKELEQASTKKQKVDDDKETTELKQCLEIIPDEEDVTIDAIHLAVKSPRIVDWKIHKEGKKSYYQIVRADRKS
ncbi:hypothetical protein Tco_1201399 [Tanacetum coccineum]